MDAPILTLSTWWGLSDKPGDCTLYLNSDGSYILKLNFYLPRDKDGNKKITGTIDSDRLKKALEYAQTNFKENCHHMIFDAGYTVEYSHDGRTIKRENDSEAWKFYMELLPEFKDRS